MSCAESLRSGVPSLVVWSTLADAAARIAFASRSCAFITECHHDRCCVTSADWNTTRGVPIPLPRSETAGCGYLSPEVRRKRDQPWPTLWRRTCRGDHVTAPLRRRRCPPYGTSVPVLLIRASPLTVRVHENFLAKISVSIHQRVRPAVCQACNESLQYPSVLCLT